MSISINLLRDLPFNLKGGGGGAAVLVFCFVQKFFSDNTRVRIFIFVVAEFNIRLYDKNTESDYFFFPHQNQNIFFSNIGNQNIFLFLEKKHNPPPFQVKWSFPNTLTK